MAGASVRIDVDDAEVHAGLRALEAAGGNLRPALDEIGAVLETSTVERFETESGPDGGGWLPSRRAEEEGGQTLTDSARLRQSITRALSGDEVQVGTNLVYGAVHQFGSDPAGGRPSGIPARPYLGLSGGDRGAVLRIVADHLAGAV